MDSSRKIRLLVVDDDPAYMYLIQRAFNDQNRMIHWDVTTAVDGEKAIRILFAEEASATLPELVLLDWNLPGVTGAEVLTRLKKHQKLRRIPVLVFSSSREDDVVHAAYDGYANCYITKPADWDDFASIIETIERFWISIARLPKVMSA